MICIILWIRISLFPGGADRLAPWDDSQHPI
jgi:hypothetical protein